MKLAAASQSYTYPARLVRVVDGDTIDVACSVDVDAGFGLMVRIEVPARLRLVDINAPEMPTPEGKAAATNLDGLLRGRPLTVRSGREDRYGRRLARVYSGDLDVSAAMVSGGFAVPYMVGSGGV